MRQKEGTIRKSITNYGHTLPRIIMNYRYVHNQLVERRAKVALHSWACFLCCKWPYSDVGLLRYHMKSMVTDDDKIDKLTQ